MADTFYPFSLREARNRGQVSEWKESHEANVKCARYIEDLIASHSPDGQLEPGAAAAALDRWGFLRTQFVLSNSVLETGGLGFEPESLRWVRTAWVPPDNDNAEFRVSADRSLLAQFVRQVHAEYQQLEMFGAEHCDPAPDQDYTGKVLILRPDRLKEECWSAQNQLWEARSGFGCSPTSSGRAVFAVCLGDGEKARWNRSDFIGVLDEQHLPDWAQDKLAELRGTAQEQAESSATEQADAPAQGGMEMR